MQRLTLNFSSQSGTAGPHLDVPDITTALVVAQINLDHGSAEIRDGERVLATIERRGGALSPYWRVS